MSERGSLQPGAQAEINEGPVVIDLREGDPNLSGFALLESHYGHDPDMLAQNTALAMLLLLEETGNSIAVGRDTKLLGQDSQEFLDCIIDALCADEKKAGYAQLFHSISGYFGGPPEFMIDQLYNLKGKKNWLMNSHGSMRPDERIFHRQELQQNELYVPKYAIAKYLSEVLERATLLHENGRLENLDPDLYYEYCGQFLPLEIEGEIFVGPKPEGLSDTVYQRLVDEAHFIYRADNDAVFV